MNDVWSACKERTRKEQCYYYCQSPATAVVLWMGIYLYLWDMYGNILLIGEVLLTNQQRLQLPLANEMGEYYTEEVNDLA